MLVAQSEIAVEDECEILFLHLLVCWIGDSSDRILTIAVPTRQPAAVSTG